MPEFMATAFSRPVATIGGSATSSGTAWRCMFEPISARLASSCSRNGIRPGRDADHLLGRDVDVLDLLDGDGVEVGLVAGDDASAP